MIALTLNQTGRYQKKFFQPILIAATQLTGLVEKQIGLSINFVSPAKIQNLNATYRGKNEPTDILSFSLAKKEINNIIELGDIFICLPVAKTLARQEKVSLTQKLQFLVVHGFLHLIGYDHETPKDQKIMFALQTQILNQCVYQ